MSKKKKRPVDPESLPWRPNVGIMVLNSDGLVWTGRRIAETDSEMAGTEMLWQMPQGGIDADEDPWPAALRELYEETGISTVTLIAEAPDWFYYELPRDLVGIALKGKYRGQKQKWYAVRFEGDDGEIAVNPPPDGHSPEFDAWEWKPMEELPALIVPFKRKVYEQVVETFAHLSGMPA